MPPTGQRRVGGIITFKVNGEIQNAKGEFTYNPGVNQKKAVTGSDKVHGYSEKPGVPMIKGAITDRRDLDVPAMQALDDAEITLALSNGKIFKLFEAWYSGSGDVKTDEGEIEVEFEGMRGEEVR